MMYEVTFWKNGRQLTMGEEFEKLEWAVEFANDGFPGADGAVVESLDEDGYPLETVYNVYLQA